MAPDGRRLSKRNRDLDLGGLREAGLSSSRIIGALASMAGLVPADTVATPEDLISAFSWQKMADRIASKGEDIVVTDGFLAEGSS